MKLQMPSSAEINSLPQPIRDYIMWLETNADPGHTLQANFQLRHNQQAVFSLLEGLQESSRYAWQLLVDWRESAQYQQLSESETWDRLNRLLEAIELITSGLDSVS